MRKRPDFYPDVESEEGFTLSGPHSPYGEPAPDIMSVFERRLQPGSKIIDVAGGDGRYAIALARAPYRHNVNIVDIDIPHLDAADRRAVDTLSPADGTVDTVEGDINSDEDMQRLIDMGLIDLDYDASLCAAFLYLAPPETAQSIFKRTSGTVVKVGGLAVVQFSTNIVRLGEDGRRIVGDKEYNYNEEEGRGVLKKMYKQSGYGDFTIDTYKIDEELMQADVLLASGIRED
jgi:SAM-dependent methyltransferase